MLTVELDPSAALSRRAEPPARAEAEASGVLGSHVATSMMDAIECGLIACNARGQVLHANRAARREMGPGRALMQDGRILACSDGSSTVLERAIQDAARHGHRRLFWIGEGAQRLMLATVPVEAAESSPAPAVLIILGRRRLCSPLGLEMLALRHGLTATETRVLGGLIETRGTREIARDHGVRLSTIRTQIQSIREKIGARNIEELLLRAGQVPALTSGLN